MDPYAVWDSHLHTLVAETFVYRGRISWGFEAKEILPVEGGGKRGNKGEDEKAALDLQMRSFS